MKSSRFTQKPGKVPRTCPQCGVAYWMWPSDLADGAGAYCGRACYTAAIRPADRVCPECGASFRPHGRGPHLTCGVICSRSYVKKRTLARFWDNVDKSGDCWLWMKARDPHGYGRFGKGPADKMAWTMTHGPIPNGLHILHDCDNPPCVRPEPGHLHLGTHAQNMAEASQRRRFPSGADWRRAHAGTTVKLTEDDVRAIRSRFAAGGVTQVTLAQEYMVGRTAIDSIIRRRSWRDID